MKIKVSELWSNPNRVIIDVRTPAEFRSGHIPGAVNLPLFSDEERVVVGTLYKQTSPKSAMIKGLEFVGPKMSGFVVEANKIAKSKKIIVHCWRGGKRSESMGWLLGMAGLNVETLEGGYKAYRNFLQEQFFHCPFNIVILGGKTGCGKTDILNVLQSNGEQIVDLEGLANHKGSAFGSLGEEEQPSTEQFENNLYETVRQLDPSKTIWVENENRSVGRAFIPEGFWKQMKSAPLINIERPVGQRIGIIKKQYGHFDKEQLKASFNKIKKRLGGQNLNAANEALDNGNLDEAIEIALRYYDKAYQHYLDNNASPAIAYLKIKEESIEQIANQLIESQTITT